MILKRLRQQKFYGWTALAGAMLVHFSYCATIFYSFGVFLPTMCEELDWSRSALSAAFTIFLIVGGILGPLAGVSISKFGARKNIIVGNLVAVLGLLGMSLVNEVWHAYLCFGVLIGGGHAFGSFIAVTTTANNWFVRRRYLAISLVFAAGGVGGLVFPPLISWLISSLGWRLCWVCLAGVDLVLVIGIAGMLIRNKPEDMGQVPDGEVTKAAQEADMGSPARRQVYQTQVDWKVGDALRTRALWLVLAFMAANMFTLTALSTHQVAYLQDLGFSPMTAATALGLLVGMSIIGRLACGVLGTKIEGRYLAAAFLLISAAGLITLMNVKALPLIYLYATLSGIGYGGINVLMSAMLGAYFGRAHFARIIGWTIPIITLFGAASPLLAGFIYDTSGIYMPAFMIALAFLGAGVVCALLARPPKPPATIPQ